MFLVTSEHNPRFPAASRKASHGENSAIQVQVTQNWAEIILRSCGCSEPVSETFPAIPRPSHTPISPGQPHLLPQQGQRVFLFRPLESMCPPHPTGYAQTNQDTVKTKSDFPSTRSTASCPAPSTVMQSCPMHPLRPRTGPTEGGPGAMQHRASRSPLCPPPQPVPLQVGPRLTLRAQAEISRAFNNCG